MRNLIKIYRSKSFIEVVTEPLVEPLTTNVMHNPINIFRSRSFIEIIIEPLIKPLIATAMCNQSTSHLNFFC